MVTADNLTQLKIVTLRQELALLQVGEPGRLADSLTAEQRELESACNHAWSCFDTAAAHAARALIAEYLNARALTDAAIEAWWYFGGSGPADSRTMMTALGKAHGGQEPSPAEVRAARALIVESIHGMGASMESLVADYRIALGIDRTPTGEPPADWQSRVMAEIDRWHDFAKIVVFVAASIVVAVATAIALGVL